MINTIQVMSRLRKNLHLIFAKISIKCHLKLSNITKTPMALDLLREEIKCVILNTVLKELRTFMVTLVQSYNLPLSKEKLDIALLLLLYGSRQKVASKLRLPEFKYFKLNSYKSKWLTKKIEIEEYPLLICLSKEILKQDGNFQTNLLNILIENLIIKISDIVAYELVLNASTSKKLAKLYCTDPFLFKVKVANLDTYKYYQSYLNSTFLNVKTYYNQTYSVTVMTKKGLVSKNLYSTEVTDLVKHSTFELYLIRFLSFINFLKIRKPFNSKN